MKTAGQILQSARKNKKLELSDVARITKIRTQFLTLIEADDYSGLPSGTVAKGFIRNYSKFLQLVPENVLATFRRDFVENKLGQIVPRALADPVSQQTSWTPRATIIAVVVLVFTVFGGYLARQYWILTGPPALEKINPKDGQVSSESAILIEGQTDPEATISIGGQLVALDKGGQFSFRVPLVSGENNISIVATSKSGKTTTLTRRVSLR